MRMQAFRSALSTAQRQLVPSTASRAFSVAAAAPSAPAAATLSAQDWLQNIKSLADRNIPIKKTKLTSFLKTVTTSEELEASKEIMQIYERKRVDPDASAAGVFVKKALELDAAQLVFEVLEANYRIGLFLEASTLNKLLSKFFKDGEFDKVFQLHDIGTVKYAVKSTDRTYDILIRYALCCFGTPLMRELTLAVCGSISTAIAQPDFDKALEIFKTAAYVLVDTVPSCGGDTDGGVVDLIPTHRESKKLMRVTCNNMLFKLKEQELADKVRPLFSVWRTLSRNSWVVAE
jgi:hypothetical protein